MSTQKFRKAAALALVTTVGLGLAACSSKSDSSSATVRDYQLTVVASPDGQHFQMSLVPKSGCGYSLFTNENWVIYEAKAMGCS